MHWINQIWWTDLRTMQREIFISLKQIIEILLIDNTVIFYIYCGQITKSTERMSSKHASLWSCVIQSP